ncbi:MAG: TetR/AcrR family transcriptional regulator [Gemmatimonadota bacterium]
MPPGAPSVARDTAGSGSQAGAARRPGRPRSERADRAIIDAALSLFAESGPEGLCMEKVAARAGVGKATLYRRWHSKEDLLLAAMAALKAPLPEPAGGPVRDDLVELLTVMCRDAADPRRAREFALLLGEGARYPRLMARYVETVVEPRREVIRSVLRRGVASGELRAGIDIDAALFMLIGAVLARGRFDPESIPPGYAERVVDELLAGLAPR